MLPRTLRRSSVEEESINTAGIVECEMRIVLFIYLFFKFYMDQLASRKKKWVEDSTAGGKRNNESLVSFSGDDLEREENVEIHTPV